ncbi:hypothetical protein DFP97_102200 [Paenibacillus prosopidis]|uniref:Uncharacterized protein n=1 Tax=Paenibacillus prosopidis TaxID=630520 RepID=A0A368W6F7_9BACL|nr:hypothetical protein DFP97_102200 [Paenibacillus prosopidis]
MQLQATITNKMKRTRIVPVFVKAPPTKPDIIHAPPYVWSTLYAMQEYC